MPFLLFLFLFFFTSCCIRFLQHTSIYIRTYLTFATTVFHLICCLQWYQNILSLDIASWYSSPGCGVDAKLGCRNGGLRPDHLKWYVAYTLFPSASSDLLTLSVDHDGKRNAVGWEWSSPPSFSGILRHETDDRHRCFLLFLFPVPSTTIMFLSNPGTGVVVQVGNGHLALGTLK